MAQSQHTVPLLAGAKITLGGVNITSKNFEDYEASELAYIIGRFMAEHSEDWKYYGSVVSAMRTLWPHEPWGEGDVSNSRIGKYIYMWLKHLGFRPGRIEGAPVWYVPKDLSEKYQVLSQRTLSELNREARKAEELASPVTYRCVCGAGPFDTKQQFKEHHINVHSEKEEEMDTKVEKDVNTIVCVECGKAISREGFKGHVFAAHKKYPCLRCFKMFDSPNGLGGHMHSHKTLTKHQRQLLDLIRQSEGLHPRDYAEKLGKSAGATSGLGRVLVSKGYVAVEGNRQNAVYFTTSKGRSGKKGGFSAKKAEKQEPKIAPAVAEPEIQRAEKKTPIEVAGKSGRIVSINGASLFIGDDGGVYVISGLVEVK